MLTESRCISTLGNEGYRWLLNAKECYFLSRPVYVIVCMISPLQLSAHNGITSSKYAVVETIFALRPGFSFHSPIWAMYQAKSAMAASIRDWAG